MLRSRAVVFDLDGTLADSAPDIAAALNVALGLRGLSPLPISDVIAMVGHGARRLAERALAAQGVTGDDTATRALVAEFETAYAAAPCVGTKLYPGVLGDLAGLRTQGWYLTVCTNKPQALADRVIDGLGIRGHFDAIVGARDGVPLKPSGDMVRLALSEADATHARAVMVGDSKADLGAGRAAGLPVVLMSHGYSTLPLAELGADAVLPGFEGLLATLDRLLPPASMR
ncbi:MAG: HAD-IA family hydrolase [Hyphomicrobium aestuarii]|nr:HAD-IA family hydrolase [Hyphomicrobium aestuarii]